MKKILFLLLLLLPSICFAETHKTNGDVNCLRFIVNGSPVDIALSEHPIITYSHNALHISTSGPTIDIPIQDISISGFQETTGIDDNIFPEQVIMEYGRIIFRELPQGSKIIISTVDGKVERTESVGNGRKVEIDLHQLPSGIYIIKTAIQTIKVTNK